MSIIAPSATLTVSWQQRTAVDNYDGHTYATAVDVSAWVSYNPEQTVDPLTGETVVANARVSTEQAMTPGDLVTLPDEAAAREVVQVRKARDVDGVLSHYVVLTR